MIERELTGSDADALMDLQARIHERMEKQEWLVDTSRGQFVEILSGSGYGIGLFEGEEMLGAWVLYYPFEHEDALGYVLGIDPGKVAHYELALLDERLRGRGLHAKMVKKLTEHAARDGRFTHIAATAHPDNQASLRGFTGNGYSVFDTRKMYTGVMRCIVYKALQNT